MKSLLVINSSARSERSITRHLTNRFAAAWKKCHPAGEIRSRDVGLNPPAFIDEAWISAAFANDREDVDRVPLAASEVLIEELLRAGAVVVGAPMYNFGMPAGLKAYVDQIVRVGRTFDLNGEGDWPYRGLIPPKPIVLITSAGASGYEPGGVAAHLNFLNGHLDAVFRFLGLTDIWQVNVGSEEHQGETFQQRLAEAERAVDDLVPRIARGVRRDAEQSARIP